jgi:hypothetical protein
MATVLTATGLFETTVEMYREVDRLRSRVLGQMRRAYQLEQQYLATRRLCGVEHQATAKAKAKASLERTWVNQARTQDQLAALLRQVEQGAAA